MTFVMDRQLSAVVCILLSAMAASPISGVNECSLPTSWQEVSWFTHYTTRMNTKTYESNTTIKWANTDLVCTDGEGDARTYAYIMHPVLLPNKLMCMRETLGDYAVSMLRRYQLASDRELIAAKCSSLLDGVSKLAWYLKYPFDFSRGKSPLATGVYQTTFEASTGNVMCADDSTSVTTVTSNEFIFSMCYTGSVSYALPLVQTLTVVDLADASVVDDDSYGNAMLLADQSDSQKPRFYCARYGRVDDKFLLSINVGNEKIAECYTGKDYSQAGDHFIAFVLKNSSATFISTVSNTTTLTKWAKNGTMPTPTMSDLTSGVLIRDNSIARHNTIVPVISNSTTRAENVSTTGDIADVVSTNSPVIRDITTAAINSSITEEITAATTGITEELTTSPPVSIEVTQLNKPVRIQMKATNDFTALLSNTLPQEDELDAQKYKTIPREISDVQDSFRQQISNQIGAAPHQIRNLQISPGSVIIVLDLFPGAGPATPTVVSLLATLKMSIKQGLFILRAPCGDILNLDTTVVLLQQMRDYVCSSSPCLNGGFCTNVTSLTYTCECPLPYTGSRCETNSTVDRPQIAKAISLALLVLFATILVFLATIGVTYYVKSKRLLTGIPPGERATYKSHRVVTYDPARSWSVVYVNDKDTNCSL